MSARFGWRKKKYGNTNRTAVSVPPVARSCFCICLLSLLVLLLVGFVAL
jgi:hypothetical protein